MKRKMNLNESFRSAWTGLNANRTRSFLSILGIIIGIAAVIAIMSLIRGSQQMILERIQSLGTNLIVVTPGRFGGAAGKAAQKLTDLFTIEDGERILSKSSAVKNVVPTVSKQLLLQYKDKNAQITVNGITPEYQSVLNFWVERGRFINTEDMKASRSVIVLGQNAASDLFEEEDPLGRSVTINTALSKYKFRVIGVMESKGQVMFSNFDNQTFVPISSAQRRLMQIKYVNSFYVEAKDEDSADEAVEQIDAVLYQKYEDDEKYNIMSQKEILSAIETVMGIMTIMLAGIAAISLLVGGIGIMNIMLVSVTERTREIGIRMAVGAKRADILLQFLWESILLCLIGGLIGIFAGWLGAKFAGWLGTKIMGATGELYTLMSLDAIVIALGFCIAIGLFFGMYPANKASKLNPVEALRYE